MLDRETPEVRRRVGELARLARDSRRDVIKNTVWLNAGGVGATLTFAGSLMAAGRPGWIVIAPVLMFALGLISIAALLSLEFTIAVAAVVDAIPRLGRRLLLWRDSKGGSPFFRRSIRKAETSVLS